MHLSYSRTTLSITSNCSLAPQHQLACPTSIQERRWFGETAGRSTDRRKAPLVRPPAGALRCWPACWWALSSTWGLRPLWPSPCWTPGPECSPWASRTPAGDTAGEETNYKKKKKLDMLPFGRLIRLDEVTLSPPNDVVTQSLQQGGGYAFSRVKGYQMDFHELAWAAERRIISFNLCTDWV